VLWKSYSGVDGSLDKISMKGMIEILKSGIGIYEGQDSRFIEIRIGQYRDHAGYGVLKVRIGYL